jgi:hypothetical protein
MGAFSLGIKQLECEADCSPPSGVEVKAEWRCIPQFHTFQHGVHRENFTFCLLAVMTVAGKLSVTVIQHIL